MTKPDIQIPASFAIDGIKTDFDNTKIQNGFDRLQPDVLAGDNLNKLIDDTYKGLNGVLDLYKGAVLYDVNETYSNKSIIFNIDENNEIKIYRSLVNNNIGNDLDDTDYWQEVSLGGSLPIGTIFPVICTEDYVPNGALPCDGTEYSKSQFEDLWTNYLTADTPLLNTCSYSDYASDIATYGSCANFGIDTVNNKFKVPTIKDGQYITQANSDSELGKSYNESLPNITGEDHIGWNGIHSGIVNNSELKSGCFVSPTYTGRGEGLGGVASGNADTPRGIKFDASHSSSTYQDNAPVQGNNVRLRYFVQVATGQINQSMMDWATWASSLQGKLNKDVSTNISTEGKSFISGLGMPSDRYVVLTLGASGSTYTAPANGYFILIYNTNASGSWALVQNASKYDIGIYQLTVQFFAEGARVWCPAAKGDIVTSYYQNITSPELRFVYAEGDE